MADLDEASDKMHDALSKIVREEKSGTMVTRWIVLAEVIDVEDGEPTFWTLASDKLPPWDRIGFLGFADRCIRRPEV